jgi:hypothetical protein
LKCTIKFKKEDLKKIELEFLGGTNEDVAEVVTAGVLP